MAEFSIGDDTNTATLFTYRYVYRDFLPHCQAMNGVFAKFPWLNNKRIIIFYANGAYENFKNFEQVGRQCSAIAATFVELNLGQNPSLHYVVDMHLNRLGHREVARKLAPLVSR
jgi:hypothetical protein